MSFHLHNNINLQGNLIQNIIRVYSLQETSSKIKIYILNTVQQDNKFKMF